MNWDTYDPLNTDHVIHNEEGMDVIVGDGFGPRPDTEDERGYMVTHINDGGGFVFDYEREVFEAITHDEIRRWVLADDRTFSPMLSSHCFTIEADDEVTGLKVVGSAHRSSLMIEKELDGFGVGLGLKFGEGILGTEIMEPYMNEEVVVNLKMDGLIEDAMNELAPVIHERSGLDLAFSEALIEGIFRVFEANANVRMDVKTEPVFSDSLTEDEVMTSPDNGIASIYDKDPEVSDLVTFHGKR